MQASGRPGAAGRRGVLLPAPAVRRRLSLSGQRVYPKSGIVLLEYDVVADAPEGNAHEGKRTGR